MSAILDMPRADRQPRGSYRLAAPVTRPNGSVVYEAVLSTPGVNAYPTLGTIEEVTPEALSRADYTDALAGLPLIDDPALHWRGVTTDEIEAARVGTILGARWDEAQEATIVQLVIDTPRGLEHVQRGVQGLSVRYVPTIEPVTGRPGITHRQTARTGMDHVLLTPSPNDDAAWMRADGATITAACGMRVPIVEVTVDEAAIRADERTKVEAEHAEALTAARADERTKVEAERPHTKDEHDAAVDQARADERAKVGTAESWRTALTLAHASGVKVANDASLTDVKRAIVRAKVPARADAKADDLDGILDGIASSLDTGDAWGELARGVRADNRNTDGWDPVKTMGI